MKCKKKNQTELAVFQFQYFGNSFNKQEQLKFVLS